MTPDEKIQILTDALRRITTRKDAPPIDPSGDVQGYLNCEIGDRGPYEAAGFGYTEGVEDALVWAFNEANSALKKINDCSQAGNGLSCFECDGGTLRVVRKPYETTRGKGEPLTIPNIPFLVCDTCGDELLNDSASRSIEEVRITAGVKYRR